MDKTADKTASPRVLQRSGSMRPPPATDGPSRGAMLRWMMDEHGVSVHRFAALCGVSPATVSNWINGGTAPTGYDLLGSKPAAAEALLRGLRNLDSGMTTQQLWSDFGVPRSLQALWQLPGQAEASQVVASLEGVVASRVPLSVTYVPNVREGMVLSRYQGRWRVDLAEELTPAWEVMGRVIGFSFDVPPTPSQRRKNAH